MSTYHTVGGRRESPCSKALEHVNAWQEVDWPLPQIMPTPGKGLRKIKNNLFSNKLLVLLNSIHFIETQHHYTPNRKTETKWW